MSLDIPPQFQTHFEPLADPQAVVRRGKVRITVLAPRVLRLEYSPDEVFEDRPSQIFISRRQPLPVFEVAGQEDLLELKTEALRLRCKVDAPFRYDTLSVELLEEGILWQYDDLDQGNLGGTGRTLDGVRGKMPIERGLLSRQGWTVVDDTASLVFTAQGWLAPRQAAEGYQDLYFFGYGSRYQELLQDYFRISGPVPMLPRWALGNWWSRYWKYSEQELGDLMREFKARQVPLSVCIIDMDWHITQTGNTCSGWTGYTWNRELFPDPPRFIQFLHDLGLRTALNLHPAEGVHPHEAAYPQMAQAMGIDPASGAPVACDLEDPQFTRAYFDYLHHPLEAEGIDFWWMDWQQGNPSRLPGLNLLWWINHLHYYDLGRGGVKRPFIFSRWGGLGNHRYPIGFSGDSIIAWDSLAFQPYFTATAANVGFGWWSHDIGGHMNGISDAELYTRWVQLGLFSPILRLHSTNNRFLDRRPWGYGPGPFEVTRRAMQLRHAFIPYLYSMAWRFYTQGIPPIRPMYHLAPGSEAAYVCPNQYTFGSELIAAPFITPADPDTRLSRQVVWLPEGDWFHFFTGRRLPGDRWHAQYGTLEDIPLFARAGAILPLGPMTGWGGVDNPDRLEVSIFPGADNTFELYEDDGVSNAYVGGQYAITRISQEWSLAQTILRIHPAQGARQVLPPRREVKLIFRGILSPQAVEVEINGQAATASTHFDPAARSLVVEGIALTPADTLAVTLRAGANGLLDRNEDLPGVLDEMLHHFRLGNDVKVHMFEHMGEWVKDPTGLAPYLVTLTPAQRRALLEAAAGCGVERITNAGEELLVMWNNPQDPRFTYQFVSEILWPWGVVKEYQQEKGIVPAFKVLHPAQDCQGSTLLKVSYAAILDLDFTWIADDFYPRPKSGAH